MTYLTPLEQLVEAFESEVLAAQPGSNVQGFGAFGGDALEFNVGSLISQFTNGGRYDVDKATLIVPDGVRPRHYVPEPGRWRIELSDPVKVEPKGRLWSIASYVANLDLTIPWIEFPDDCSEVQIRLDPLPTPITRKLAY